MKNQEAIINGLNALLASYSVHYQNLRALHWNIKGQSFFELHQKYEELYGETQLVVDNLAERILTYNAAPLHTLSDYLKNSVIQENGYISDGAKGVQYVVDAQKALLKLEMELFKIASDENDEGTSSFISDLIKDKEKSIWMFTAWLGR